MDSCPHCKEPLLEIGNMRVVCRCPGAYQEDLLQRQNRLKWRRQRIEDLSIQRRHRQRQRRGNGFVSRGTP